MRIALVLLVAAACSKGSAKNTPDPEPSKDPAKGAAKDPSGGEAEPVEQAKGVSVKLEAAEFSGSYDKVFGRYTNGTDPNVIVFVKGCAKLTCDPGPWEPEQVAHVCPKAYLATATFAGDKKGKFKVDLKFAGPADNPSTATKEGVWLDLTKLDNDGIAGKASQKDEVSNVKGEFTATLCPRT
jgi:hypothetical protein